MKTAIRYDVNLLAEDMADRGWFQKELAAKAGVSEMTVTRFLRGEQTAKTAKKIANALGYRTARRYRLVTRRVAA